MPRPRSLIASARRLIDRALARSDSSFKFAFLFLDRPQAQAIGDVYRFCRIVDDIVDERAPGPEGRATAAAELARWRRACADFRGPDQPDPALCERLAWARERFGLRAEPFVEIVDGCQMDLEHAVYDTDEQLELYCYRVASCVGLLCIPIFGDDSPAARRYARHLGLALQYTNILRDVAEDALRGRVYLPRSLLGAHGCSPEAIFAGRYDQAFVAAATEFSARAEAEYRAAWVALDEAPGRAALLPAEIMGRTYHQLLDELRAISFDVFTRRPSLRRRDKLRAAFVAAATTRLPPLIPRARAPKTARP